jgi:hypothetical protein
MSWMRNYNFTALSLIHALTDQCVYDMSILRQAALDRNITIEDTYIVPSLSITPRNPNNPEWKAIGNSKSTVFWICLSSTNDVPNAIYYFTDIGLLSKNKIILGMPIISYSSYIPVRNYTLSQGVNLTNLPIFFYGADSGGVFLTRNYSSNPQFTYFENVRANYNLTSIKLRENLFYSMIYDYLYISISGLANAVNNYGVDIRSIANRSWTDPKSSQYPSSNFSTMRGKYFSQDPNYSNFFLENLQFASSGIYRAKMSFFQLDIDAYINGASATSQMQALMSEDLVKIFKPATWDQHGSTTPPRLSPITCTLYLTH